MPVLINNVNLANQKRNNDTIKLNLDLRTFDILCRYILQPKNVVRMDHVVNLRNLLLKIEPSTYENDPEKVKRMSFLFKAVEGRLENNITDRDMLIVFINGGLDYQI